MKSIWLDAQLSPRIARWITANFPVEAIAVRDLGLRDAEDIVIFERARVVDAVVLTKDSDFLELIERLGAPPKIIWLSCGNTSESALQHLLSSHLTTALAMLHSGEKLVEIGAT
jgi:predicted nuclease of predicted toxin-antitoxin system